MNFTAADYQNYQASMSNNSGANSNAVKVGFFKLADGEEAIVRFNIGSVDDLKFASVHKAIFGTRYEGLPGFGGISCLNPINSYENKCPLCAAVAAGHPVVDKAKKLVYVQMLVSYKDRATGTWSVPAPVIWERPAGFSREIATILSEYGDMRVRLFKVSRAGQRTDTRYTILPIDKDSPVFRQEMIPADFSAFANFNIARHSYWEKTADEINDYLANGKFPEMKSNNTQAATVQAAPVAPVAEVSQYTQPVNQTFGAPFIPQQAVPAAPVTPTFTAPAPQPTTEQPARNFSNGFSNFKF